MGFFGGGNSKTSTVNNTETNNLNFQGNKGQTIAGNKNSTINVLDGGAIAGAFRVTEKALTAVINSEKSAFKFGEKALVFSERAGRSALKFAYDAGRPNAANQKQLIYVIGAVLGVGVVVVGAGMYKSRGKK